MKNKNKLITLIFIVLALIVFVSIYLLIRYSNNISTDKNNTNNMLGVWVRTKYIIYDKDNSNNVLGENTFNDDKYFKIEENKIYYCMHNEGAKDSCTEYNYEYNNNKFKISDKVYFLLSGEYDVSFEKEKMIFEYINDGYRNVFYFERVLG